MLNSINFFSLLQISNANTVHLNIPGHLSVCFILYAASNYVYMPKVAFERCSVNSFSDRTLHILLLKVFDSFWCLAHEYFSTILFKLKRFFLFFSLPDNKGPTYITHAITIT